MFETPTPGMFVVRYEAPGDMEPALQHPLVDAIRAASRIRPVVIVFVVGERIRSVDFAVPGYWIKVLADPAVNVGAMVMVTRSLAVEIAAKSFGAATRFRQHPLEIRVFDEEKAAIAWVKQFMFAPATLSADRPDVLTRHR
jgi:hypothetical protein